MGWLIVVSQIIHECINKFIHDDECDFELIQLAVLGADITGDSHWFDSDRTGGKLLLSAIAFFFHEAEGYVPDNRQMLYDFFGIETNGISGTATVFSISFFDWSETPLKHMINDVVQVKSD